MKTYITEESHSVGVISVCVKAALEEKADSFKMVRFEIATIRLVSSNFL